MVGRSRNSKGGAETLAEVMDNWCELFVNEFSSAAQFTKSSVCVGVFDVAVVLSQIVSSLRDAHYREDGGGKMGAKISA